MDQNPFAGKNLRCLYDPQLKKWWFSAVDLCAILTDSSYETGRLYWNAFKRDRDERENQLMRKSHQLKFPAADGKYYFTDVLDTKEVVFLIQIIPSPKADTFRLWLAEMVVSCTPVEPLLVQAGLVCAAEILDEYEKRPETLHERLTVTRKRLV